MRSTSSTATIRCGAVVSKITAVRDRRVTRIQPALPARARTSRSAPSSLSDEGCGNREGDGNVSLLLYWGSSVKPELRRVGNGQNPIVVIDEFTGRLGEILKIAETLAPYPALSGNYYPGLRRIIAPADEAAYGYVEQLCEAAGPFIAGAFDVEGFTLTEASFSMVTTAPADLSPPQRAPHFDSTEPKHYALLH